MKTKILFILLGVLISLGISAQVGSISGTVTDVATGESLIGATVVVKGTTLGAATDFDGNFTVKGIKPGTYQIEVSYISYATKSVEKVVTANKVTALNVSLESDQKVLTAVEIVATRRTGTEMSVITELKKADQIAVGVSASQIAKTQDRDASAVIRRVPGVNIVDGRFVVIRGLSERYNTVMLNDVITPSLEVDKKAFSFDLIPSSMIDRMLVFKSGGADLPGEFAGGVIKIYTKNIPDENFVSVSLQSAYRMGVTGKSALYNAQGGTSALGFDKGTALPANMPARVRANAVSVNVLNQFNNNWSATPQTLNPDLRLNVATGTKFKIGKIDAGNLTTLTYSNTWNNFQQQRNRWGLYSPEKGASHEIFNFADDYTSNKVNIGLISNFNLRLSSKTSIDFRNFFNQSGINETTIRNGYTDDGQEYRNYAFRYEQRSFYSGQLALTSKLSDRDEIMVTGGFGNTDRSEPDYRRVRTNRALNSNDPFKIILPPSAATFDAARFYSKLNETSVVGAGSWEHKLGEVVDGDRFQNKVKVGFYAEQKDRSFSARWMSYKASNYSKFDQSILDQNIDQVFSAQNLGLNGLTIEEGTNPSDFYSVRNNLLAGYASYSMAVTDRLNAVAGVRAEFNRLQLNSEDYSSIVAVDYPVLSVIPSLNLSYNLTEKQILRFAYTNSVNRPEFREVAPFSYYDFNNDANIQGNPDLKIATVNNLDLRWEIYPNPTELITFGVFYKSFKNPIERFIQGGSGGNTLTYTFANAQKATNAGVEVEVRKSLEGLTNNSFVNKLTLLFNASLLQSKVSVNNAALGFEGQENNRSLQGQSPYLVNTGLYYNDQENGFQMNALYNIVGKSIYAVGDLITATQYEMPRNVIDINFTKRIGKNFEAKGGVSDLLNQSYRRIQDSDRNKSINGNDENILNYKMGTVLNFGFTYKF